MVLQAETTGDPSAAEFGTVLNTLGLAQTRVAEIFDVTPRHVRRWKHGDRRLPHAVAIVIRLLAAGAITLDQIEKVVASAPIQTNGRTKPRPPREAAAPLASLASLAQTNGAEPEPLAPLEEAPEQSALARVETATFADSGLSTAQKVLALGPGRCCWPHNDPRHPDFYYCSRPTATPPYCNEHRRAAYLARSPASDPATPERASGAAPQHAPQRRIWGAAPRRNPDQITTSSHSALNAPAA